MAKKRLSYKDMGFRAFRDKKFDLAKSFFSLSLNARNKKETLFLISLCESAKEHFDDAAMLLEFYLFSKVKDYDKFEEILNSFEKRDDASLALDKEDAISYADFKAHIENGANFKEALCGVMSGTKLIIKDSDSFLDFIENLLDNGFEESGIRYFETFLEVHGSFGDRVSKVADKIRGISR